MDAIFHAPFLHPVSGPGESPWGGVFLAEWGCWWGRPGLAQAPASALKHQPSLAAIPLTAYGPMAAAAAAAAVVRGTGETFGVVVRGAEKPGGREGSQELHLGMDLDLKSYSGRSTWITLSGLRGNHVCFV